MGGGGGFGPWPAFFPLLPRPGQLGLAWFHPCCHDSGGILDGAPGWDGGSRVQSPESRVQSLEIIVPRPCPVALGVPLPMPTILFSLLVSLCLSLCVAVIHGTLRSESACGIVDVFDEMQTRPSGRAPVSITRLQSDSMHVSAACGGPSPCRLQRHQRHQRHLGRRAPAPLTTIQTDQTRPDVNMIDFE